jgi:hypothetical protein
MAHFMECIDSKYLGALHFVDGNMQPRSRVMTIKTVRKGRPPAAGKNTNQKWCVYFEESEKGAFFSNGQLKRLANTLMCADPDGWVGAKLTISCAPTKYAGQDVMGMVILKAENPRRPTPPKADSEQPNQATEPLDPDAFHANE